MLRFKIKLKQCCSVVSRQSLSMYITFMLFCAAKNRKLVEKNATNTRNPINFCPHPKFIFYLEKI